MAFGVETAVWTVEAEYKAGKWYRWFPAAEQCMVNWHKDSADASRKRLASAWGGDQVNGKGGGDRRKGTAVGESRNESKQNSKVPGPLLK